MKRTGHLIEKIATLENLYLAFHKASKGKQAKKEVRAFADDFDSNIESLRREVLDGTIEIGDFRYFTIHDPKERVISAAPFRDRVLQHAIMNVCHPYFDRTLIDTTYATRKGKGVYAALDKAVAATTRYAYTVKLDVRKYYDSIDHGVLKAKIRRLFKDKVLLALFDKIIDCYCVTEGKGLPIGNLTSQYFANLYLSDLDHRAKELWHATVYIRYMDDILIASDDRVGLKTCVEQMMATAYGELKLTFKPPVYRRAKCGQTFLGYKVLPYRYTLAGRSKRRFRTKLITYTRLMESGRWSETEYQEHILPLLSFVRHADSEAFRRDCLKII